MARIRTIKPEFFDDEKISNLSEGAALLYVGTWVFADDEGIIRSSTSFIKSKIFPHKTKLKLSKVDGWLTEIKKMGLLLYFMYNGEGYFIIKNFRNHQRIDKPQTSKLPKAFIDQILRAFVEDSKSPPVPNSNSNSNSKGDDEGKKEFPPLPPPENNFLNGSEIKGFLPLTEIQKKVLSDEAFVAAFWRMGITNDLLSGWLDAFEKWLAFTGESLKQEKDYRTHFKNWIAKIPYQTIKPSDYDPGKNVNPQQSTLSPTEQKLLNRYK